MVAACSSCALTGPARAQVCILTDKKRSFEAMIESQRSTIEKSAQGNDEKKRRITHLELQVRDLQQEQRASASAQKISQTDVADLKSNIEWYKTGVGQTLQNQYWKFKGWR